MVQSIITVPEGVISSNIIVTDGDDLEALAGPDGFDPSVVSDTIIDGAPIFITAQNPDYPDAPICLDVFMRGRLLGQVLADRHRPDLERAGFGGGRNGFAFVLPGSAGLFKPEWIEVRRSLDGEALPFSDDCLGLKLA